MSKKTSDSTGIPGIDPHFGARVRLIVIVICRLYGVWLVLHSVVGAWYGFGSDFSGDHSASFRYHAPLALAGLVILTGAKWIAGLIVPPTIEEACPVCGYALASPPPARCPECGVSIRALEDDNPPDARRSRDR